MIFLTNQNFSQNSNNYYKKPKHFQTSLKTLTKKFIHFIFQFNETQFRMSLVPHSFFPRSQFDMDRWTNPMKNMHSTLDLFDAFDELDHVCTIRVLSR